MNLLFEILVWLELAGIVAVVALALAPASFWALCRRKPPVWTRAASDFVADEEPHPVDDPLALENFVRPQTAAPRDPLAFGEMG